jgi:hypothetical protein
MAEPFQLPLFPDQASLTRIRPARNESRFYRLEVWPDLFGHALLARQWGRLGSAARLRLAIRTRTRVRPSTPSPGSSAPSAAAATGTAPHDPDAGPAGGDGETRRCAPVPESRSQGDIEGCGQTRGCGRGGAAGQAAGTESIGGKAAGCGRRR